MVVKENELMIIPWTASFEEKFIIENNMNFLLNNISIYGCVKSDSLGKVIDKKVNFDIRIINDKKVIYPLSDYESYFLNGERLIRTSVVEIKASDYVKNVEQNGNFTFVLNEEDNG